MNPHQILKEAQKNTYAIGSFNFCTAEILKAIIMAAAATKSPVIVSTSEGESNFLGMNQAAALVGAWRKEFFDLPIFLNLDHGKSLEKIKEAIEAGYNMVHFDGSQLDYEENIRQTKEVVDYTKYKIQNTKYKIIVEGELGYLRGASALHEELLEIKEEDLTLPEQAADFVKKTGVDSLAIVIGNAHGIFIKSLEKLYLDRLEAIYRSIGNKVFLVLHGGSGVPEQDIKKAIGLGIVKINVNTELRLTYQSALKEFLDNNPRETTPYKILMPAFEAVGMVVEKKIKLFRGL